MKGCKMVLRSLGRQISQNRVRPGAQTKVTVIITTYNHERFINEAVDSVLMQETDFDYDVVIIEDCSTDDTRYSDRISKGPFPEDTARALGGEQVR